MNSRDAQELLRPYFEAFLRIIRGGWDDYAPIRDEHPYLDATTRANFVHAAQVQRARTEFDSDAGAWIVDINGLTFVNVESQAYVRIKKFNDKLRSSNIPTRQIVEMLGQQRLPQFGAGAVLLELGYRLNKTQTAIASINVTKPGLRRNLWDFEITDDGVDNVHEHPSMFGDDSGGTKTTFNVRRPELGDTAESSANENDPDTDTE